VGAGAPTGREIGARARDLSRREFGRLAGRAAAAVAASPLLGGLLGGCGGGGACDPASDPGGCLPGLGGAPDSHEGRVIAAFCDVVIPGAHRDPVGTPGAIDVGAPALFFDPALPAAPLVGVLVAYLDGTARRDFADREFLELTVEEREQAVEIAIAGFPLSEFAVQMAKLAYYSSPGAAAALGYPGANPGYRGDPDFSFGAPLAVEITEDGNYP
jgi:hypothetical protein